MTTEEAIHFAKCLKNNWTIDFNDMADFCDMAIDALSADGDLISRADAIEAVMAEGRKVYTSEYANAERIIHEGDAVEALAMLPSAELPNLKKKFESADAVSEDTQTEERARFVAKETELAHIEARLENAEKRLQGACVANFVAKQLERLKDMTDEERLQLLHTLFPPADREELKERLEEHD